jgi:thioredoxin reductase/polyferredoxin
VLKALQEIFESPNLDQRRPDLKANKESNIPGLYIIGDLAGAPVIKLAMAQGFEVIEHIAAKPDARGSDPSVFDLIVVGAGAAGLNAALAAREKGLRVVVLEKGKIANTIEDFPEGKWVYAEPDDTPPKGKLWLDGARKEDLVRRWRQIVTENQLDVRAEEGLERLERQKDGTFRVRSAKSEYRARRIVLATGQRGSPRKLRVPGEEREQIYHRLYSPRHYKNENILVVGGGNGAVEAALVLAEQNRVTISYRGGEFSRIFKDNERKLNEALAAGRIRVLFHSNVKEFRDGEVILDTGRVPYDHAFVLIGAELPVKFLKSVGIRLENEWTGNWWRAAGLACLTLLGLSFVGGKAPLAGGLVALAAFAALLRCGFAGDRFAWLAVSFLVSYSVYGIKSPGPGNEFWPYRGWAYQKLTLFDRSPSFWYTVLYSLLMTVFGIQALKRWGLDRKDKFQIWRYVSLLGFQWIFFFLIPEFLFQWAVKYQWVGEKLAQDPVFAQQAWRSYGIVYAWPLFFYTFFNTPHQVWVVWGVLLTFVLLPLFALFHGKRYCSWICGCGGLAETFGDRWRHLAPKGPNSIRWEWMNLAVLLAAAAITVMMLLRDVVAVFRQPAGLGLEYYHLIVDIWLVGILPVTLYPFLGGKVWCRYWCPLAKLMHLFSKAYVKLGISRFHIHANDKCIGCLECTRNCQVGIPVMSFAMKQQPIDNASSSCIGCGICVTVCPMDVLSFVPVTELQSRAPTGAGSGPTREPAAPAVAGAPGAGASSQQLP